MPLTQITSGGIQDGTITNDDISASATIDATKITGLDKISEGNTEAEVVDTGSNGHFKVTTEGTERLRVDSSGRCGIGTSSPGSGNLLHIADTSKAATARTGVKLQTTDSLAADTGLPVVWSGNIGTQSDYTWASITGRKENATSGQAGGYLQFATGSSAGAVEERVRITSTGAVGIGTTSPQSQLDVRGANLADDTYGNVNIFTTEAATTNYGGSIALGGGTTGGTSPYVCGKIKGARDGASTYSGYLSFLTMSTGSVITERMRLDNSGRLLVGTSTSNAPGSLNSKIQVEALDFTGSYSAVRNSADTGGPQLVLGKSRGTALNAKTVVVSGDTLGSTNFFGADGTNFIEGASIAAFVDGTPGANDMPGRLVFSTTADGASSPTERMRIDQAGRVQIGTTSLVSAEQLAVTKGSGSALTVNVYNSAATATNKNANPILRLATQGGGADCCTQYTDSQSHNYYFGGNNGGAYVVANSNGVRLSNGGTSWASDSDERVKDIIEPITDGLDKVSTLRAVIGKYKTDDEDKRRSFLIAQDVQEVLPEAVYDEQGTLMLAYTDTIPLLVAALKESKERIEQLEAKVAALESA